MMIEYFLLFELICFVGSYNGEIFVSDKIDLDSNENSELIKGNGDSVAIINNPSVKNIKQLSDYRNDELTFRERVFAKPKRSQGNFESVSLLIIFLFPFYFHFLRATYVFFFIGSEKKGGKNIYHIKNLGWIVVKYKPRYEYSTTSTHKFIALPQSFSETTCLTTSEFKIDF